MSADLTYDGYKLVALKSIIGPGDVKRRQATKDVKDLAESIRDLGDEPMHAITARKTKRGWEIIAGRDRYSALLLLKAQRTWVHVVTHATPLGLVKAEAHENLRRRQDDRGALLAALDKAEAAITGQASAKDEED
ncbi:MAG TPA: ParB N-terminal domain-containing protein, partial [Polyangia bacterium]|nr:ParB N-terminal domain-containing protein [Polyangia bacterium]